MDEDAGPNPIQSILVDYYDWIDMEITTSLKLSPLKNLFRKMITGINVKLSARSF